MENIILVAARWLLVRLAVYLAVVVGSMTLVIVGAWVLSVARAGECEVGAFGCGHMPNHGEYQLWKNKREGSCCNGHDCRPIRADRDMDGKWSIYIPELRKWVAVPDYALMPPDKLHDGRSHGCTSDPLKENPYWCRDQTERPCIYCFTPAEGKY